MDIVDQVQRRPTEIIKGLDRLFYKERMRRLKLHSVEENKLREPYQGVQIHHMVKIEYGVNYSVNVQEAMGTK